MSERHPDLELTDEQVELLEELGIDPDELYPVRLQKPGDFYAPGGTGWADPRKRYLIFIDGEPSRFRYWMGEENAELVVKHRDVMIYQVSKERLEYHSRSQTGGGMTRKEAMRLSPGDTVHWTDPDDGMCSKDIVIRSIEDFGDFVSIVGADGGELECLPEELS